MKALKRFIDVFSFEEVTVDKKPEGFFDSKRIMHFIIGLLQFIGIFAIIKLYQFEKSSGIIEYSPVVILTFIIYSFTPLRYKHAVLFLSIVCIILHAFGIVAGTLFFCLGFMLIGICRLKIRFSLKLVAVLLLFTVFAVAKTELFFITRISTLVSYIMPMFMFRIILYLYELKNGLVFKSFWQGIVYFFLLPNIFFLFFPIIDFKNYIRTYYSVPEKEMWQKGIRWMLRGLFHIFAYRLLCSYFLITPLDVHDLPSLLHYLFSNYFLIVRLSGIFHFIIGLLCMFGMNLPQAFNNYFIATSFVDLWRRINIYWRDFILKVFFYPIMFSYKKRIKRYLLPATMMTVFFITFLLHSYQLFWITGHLNLRSVDLFFWITIGFLITANSMIIEKEALTKHDKPAGPVITTYLTDTLKIIGMLVFMSVMWGLWNSKTINEWLFLMSYINVNKKSDVIHLLLFLILFIISGVLLHYVVCSNAAQKIIKLKPSQTLFLTLPVILITLLFAGKKTQSALPNSMRSVIKTISNDNPTVQDKKNAEIGYYDRLIEGDEDVTIGIGSRGFKKRLKKNPYNAAYYLSDSLLNRRMKPNLNIKGLDHDFITNSYGIRDKQYELIKKQGTYRFALLGGSYEMGSGVSNNQNFEYITEENLNKHIPDSHYRAIEIWNFAAGGYYIIEHLELLNTEVFKCNPDAVIYFAHSDERNKMIKDFSNVIKRKVPIHYKFLNDIIKLSGVKSYMGESQIKELLNPYIDCVLQWSYIEMARICKQHHSKIIWVYLLTTGETLDTNEYNAIYGFAKQAGYITLDLSNVYGTLPRTEIIISELNTHPNVLGHKIIAKGFYNEILKHKKEIFNKNQ